MRSFRSALFLLLLTAIALLTLTSCDRLDSILGGTATTAAAKTTAPATTAATTAATTTAHAHTPVTIPAKAPSCTEGGWTEGVYCATCHAELVPQTILPLAHRFESGACILCGYTSPLPNTEGLICTLNKDGKGYTVVGAGNWKAAAVVTIGAYKDLPITAIGEEAFIECTSLTEVILPNTLTEIGDFAFAGCTALESVTVPPLVTRLGEGAFLYCEDLRSVSFTEASRCQKIGRFAFGGCVSLSDFVLPDDIGSIGEGAFFGCDLLTHTENGFTYLDNWAIARIDTTEASFLRADTVGIADGIFASYPLAGITIPASVKKLSENAFFGAPAIPIDVEKTSTSFTVIDGSLYSTDGTLLRYATYKGEASFTVPASVTRIGSWAFYQANALKTLDFEEGSRCASIGDYAFLECPLLSAVSLPSSVTDIGKEAFSYCPSMTALHIPTSVTYIGEYALRGCLAATVYAEHTSFPWTWNGDWNPVLAPVIWDSSNKDTTSGGFIYLLVDGVRYRLGNGIATVVRQPKSLPQANIPDRIIYKSVAYPVQKIAANAFKDCTALTAVQIPASVMSVGDFPFIGCTSLSKISVAPESEYCRTTENALLTENGTVLVQYAPACTATAFEIPASVTRIADYAFENCTALRTITFAAENACTEIGLGAFSGCTSLEQINLPKGLTAIENYTFSDCEALRTVTFTERNECKTIGIGAFEWCTSLEQINLPMALTAIGESAFYGCESLPTITLGRQLTSVGAYAFGSCDSLTIYIEQNINMTTWNENWNPDHCPISRGESN